VGLVKSDGEIARIQAILSNPRFVNGELLFASFLTESATVARLLPPGFEPADRPVVTVGVGRWESNCVGDYEGGSISVAARYGGTEGDYVIAMYMSTDAAIIFGRELFGEPKKQAGVGIYRQGPKMCGWIERRGIRLIEIKADLTADLGPAQTSEKTFNIKALPASNGDGLQSDAVVTVADWDNDVRVNRTGRGSVVLRGTVLDPIDEIEVREVLRAGYLEYDLDCHVRNIGSIPAAEYLPYYYGRTDDWSLLSTEDTLKSF